RAGLAAGPQPAHGADSRPPYGGPGRREPGDPDPGPAPAGAIRRGGKPPGRPTPSLTPTPFFADLALAVPAERTLPGRTTTQSARSAGSGAGARPRVTFSTKIRACG